MKNPHCEGVAVLVGTTSSCGAQVGVYKAEDLTPQSKAGGERWPRAACVCSGEGFGSCLGMSTPCPGCCAQQVLFVPSAAGWSQLHDLQPPHGLCEGLLVFL